MPEKTVSQCETCHNSNECPILNPYKCNSYAGDPGTNYPDDFSLPRIPSNLRSKLRAYIPHALS